MGFNGGLEEEEAEGTVGVDLHLVAFSVLNCGHIGGRGNDFTKDFEHAVNANVLLATAAHQRNNTAVDETLADAVDGLFVVEFHLVEILHHEFLVVLGCHLKEVSLHFLSLVGEVGGDVANGGLAAVAAIGELLHEQKVDNAVETRTAGDRELDGHNLVAEHFLELSEHIVEVALFGLELVHGEDERFLDAVHSAILILSTNFHTVLRIDEHQTSVGDIEGGNHITHKVVTAWAVDEVDLLAILLGVEEGREH